MSEEDNNNNPPEPPPSLTVTTILETCERKPQNTEKRVSND